MARFLNFLGELSTPTDLQRFDYPAPESRPTADTAKPPGSANPIEPSIGSCLFEFHRRIEQLPQGATSLQRHIRQAIGPVANRTAIDSASRHSGGNPFAQRLCLFAPFWIREPRTWDGQGDILDHLFVDHPVPRQLYPKWRLAGDAELLWQEYWFLIYAQGGNLRNAGKCFG